MEKPQESPEEQLDLVADQGEPCTEEPLPQHEGFEEIEVTDDIDETEEPENLPTRTQQEKHQHSKNKFKQKLEFKKNRCI